MTESLSITKKCNPMYKYTVVYLLLGNDLETNNEAMARGQQ
jgi:hypothetical protein